MRKTLLLISIAVFAAASAAYASSYIQPSLLYGSAPRPDTVTDVSIDKNGAVNINGAVVVQYSGSNIFAQTVWGNATIRWVITTNKDTVMTRRFGGETKVSELKLGDYVNVTGTIYGLGGDSLVVKADKVKNWSKEEEQSVFSGTAASVDFGKSLLTIIIKEAPNVLAKIPAGLLIKKGEKMISLSEVNNGDMVVSASGAYNALEKTLQVENMEIYQDQSIFVARNFQGKLKSLSSTNLPSTMIVNVDGRDYTVALPAGVTLLNKARGNTTLQRFVTGDTVRIYGTISKTDFFSIINVEIVRNINI